MNDNHLRRQRLQRKISLMGLAQQAGTSPAWLTYIERYGHLPGPELRQRIARALEATEDEIWPELAAVSDERGEVGENATVRQRCREDPLLPDAGLPDREAGSRG